MTATEPQLDRRPEGGAARQARPTGTGGRVPPHNLDAEEALLGAMLLSRDAVAAASEVLSSADAFYRPAHAHIFDVITILTARGAAVDPITVADELRRRELLDLVGGHGTLIELQAGAPGTANAAYYARIVRDHALLRRLITAAGSIADRAYGLPEDVRKAVDEAESLVFDIARHEGEGSTAPIKDLLDESLTRLEELYERGSEITGTPTGFIDLDAMTSGLQPGSLVVVGARPAMGKCVAADTLVVDPTTGARRTIEDLVRAGQRGEDVHVWSLDAAGAMVPTHPSAFVDDGHKPVFRVRTRLGRAVVTTLAHPFLTPVGWRPLHDIDVGQRVAVPARMPVFGVRSLPRAEVDLLALLLGAGELSGPHPVVSTSSERAGAELHAAVADLGGSVVVRRAGGQATLHRIVRRDGIPNRVDAVLRRHRLLGVASCDLAVPDAVFTLPRAQLARFLTGLAAARGPSVAVAGGHLVTRTPSERLASDVAHLLLRFGLVARISPVPADLSVASEARWEVAVAQRTDLTRLASEAVGAAASPTGFVEPAASPEASRSAAAPVAAPATACVSPPGPAAEALPAARTVRTTRPTNPPRPGAAAFSVPSATGHHGPVPHHGGTLVAEADPVLADAVFDEVVEITALGARQVYDLTIPDLHNFVAGDVCVHNTSFALGMATHAATKAGKPVLVFSLEMSKVELSQRLLCSEAHVESGRVRNGKLTEKDWNAIANAIGRLAEAPIWIDDNPNVTVMEIRSKARRLRSEIGPLGMVVVDYIQLMTGRTAAESRQVEVSEISRGLKVLARELECPVVALAQLNRGLEARADKRPMLSDLRESGALEQDADIVMFIYRDEMYNPDSQNQGEAEIIVAKHRSGPTGVARLAFLGHFTKFANMARDG